MPIRDLITRPDTGSLAIPISTTGGTGSDGYSPAVNLSDLDSDVYVVVTGIAGGETVDVMCSNDGTNWLKVGATISADGSAALSKRFRQGRFLCSHAGSGTPVGTFTGSRALAAA